MCILSILNINGGFASNGGAQTHGADGQVTAACRVTCTALVTKGIPSTAWTDLRAAGRQRRDAWGENRGLSSQRRFKDIVCNQLIEQELWVVSFAFFFFF